MLATLHDCRIYYILDDHILTDMEENCKRKFGEVLGDGPGVFTIKRFIIGVIPPAGCACFPL